MREKKGLTQAAVAEHLGIERTTIMNEINHDTTGYNIASPDCGRDRNGVFHCECGNCTERINVNMGVELRRIANVLDRISNNISFEYAKGAPPIPANGKEGV